MKNMRILISTLLIFTFVCTSIPVFAEKQEVSSQATTATETLMGLNVIDSIMAKKFKPEDNITKAECAKIIVALVGMSELAVAKEETTSIADVPYSHEAYKEISTLIDMGILSLDADGTFKPNDNVTLEQTIRMLLNALGYKDVVEASGTNLINYMSLAIDLKLLTNIKGVGTNVPINKGIFAVAVYNALDVAVLEVETGDQTKKTFVKGNTLLYEKLKVYKGTGIVTATKYARLDSAVSLKDNEVEVDGLVLKFGTTNASDLFGYRIKYYYKIDSSTDDKTMLYMSLVDGKNNTLFIPSEDVDSGTTSSLIKYTDKATEKVMSATITSDAKFVYNGRPLYSPTIADLMPINGIINLYDTEGSGQYNIVSISQYSNYVVDYVDREESVVKVKERTSDNAPALTNNSIELDANNKDYDIRIIKDNSEITLAEIRSGDIMSLSVSKAGTDKLIIAWISSKAIRGIISEFLQDKLIIKDTTYKIDPEYKDTEIGKLDAQVALFLDASGKIAYYNREKKSGVKYGYLVKAIALNNISSEAEFKIFNIDSPKGEMMIYKNANNILVDGMSQDSSGLKYTGEMVAALLYKAPNYGMLISYKINNDGDLNEVLLPKDCTNIPLADQNESEFRLNFSGDVSFAARLINQYRKSTKTKYILVPADSRATTVTDEDYEISTNVSRYTYTSFLYNVTRDLSPGIVVVKGVGRGSSLSNVEVVTVVDKMVYAVNKSGENVLKIYGFIDGTYGSVEFSDDPKSTYFYYRNMDVYVQSTDGTWTLTKMKSTWSFDKTYKQLKCGDMVQLLRDKQGKVTAYRVIFDSALLNETYLGAVKTWKQWDNGSYDITEGYHYDSGLYVAYAKVMDIYGTNLIINPNSSGGYPSTWNQSFPIEKAKVYIYRRGSEKIEKATISQISKGDYVVMRARSVQSSIDIVIIK